MSFIFGASRLKLASAVAALVLVTATAGFAYASGALTASAPTSTAHFTVHIGGGHNNDDFTNLQYTPDTLNIYPGDTVTFKQVDRLEPHTVTFGPKKLLDKLAKDFVGFVPHKNGPPSFPLLTQVVQPTARTAYNGMGFANSGVLSANYPGVSKTSWTIKFTKAGVYHYFCLIHYPFMTGTIVVNPRPGNSHLYHVEAGYGSVYKTSPLTADTYFPENLTIHAGDTVEWSSSFHTITFAPAGQIAKMRKELVLKTKNKAGKWKYAFNPGIVLPSSTNGCGANTPCLYGGGFLNSGLLQQTGPKPVTFEVTFTKAGHYHYGCLIHDGMDGNITVLPATM